MIQIWLRPWIRIGWILVLLVAIGFLLLSLPNYLSMADRFITVQNEEGPLKAFRMIIFIAGRIFPILATVLSLSLAVLIFHRRPDEPMTVFFSFYLLLYATIMTGPLEVVNAYWLPERTDLAMAAQSTIFPLPNIVLLLIFPNGKFQPRWTKYLVLLSIVILISTLFFETRELARPSTWQVWTLMSLNYAILILSIGVQIFRYRNIYSYPERQQTKWIIYGILVWFASMGFSSVLYYQMLYLPPGAPEPWWQPLGSALWFLILCILPVVFTIAILRSRLWDIDVIIRKTLQYALLTSLLALTYFGGVVLLQMIIPPLTGEAESPIVIVISTLTIAALFNPLRTRIQDFIDHRFYRKKYNTEQALAQFASKARDEMDMDNLIGSLVGLVKETMEPENISIWMKSGHKTGYWFE